MHIIDRWLLEPVASGCSFEECGELLSQQPSADTTFLNVFLRSQYECCIEESAHGVPLCSLGRWKLENGLSIDTMSTVELLKQYHAHRHDQWELHFKHMSNLMHVFVKTHDIDSVLEFFPSSRPFFAFRAFRFLDCLYALVIRKRSVLDLIQDMTASLMCDPCLHAISKHQNIRLDTKVREIVIMYLCRIRTQLIVSDTARFKSLLLDRGLDPAIVHYYNTFQHSNPDRHGIISQVVCIIQGDDESYYRRLLYGACYRKSSNDVNFADLLHLMMKHGEADALMIEILSKNMDIMVQLRKHRMGFTGLTNMLRYLQKSVQMHDMSYHLILHLTKLIVNSGYAYAPLLAFKKIVWVHGYNIGTDCVICMESFEPFRSFAVQCTRCSTVLCTKCCQRLSAGLGYVRCPVCRQEGNIQGSPLSWFNLL